MLCSDTNFLLLLLLLLNTRARNNKLAMLQQLPIHSHQTPRDMNPTIVFYPNICSLCAKVWFEKGQIQYRFFMTFPSLICDKNTISKMWAAPGS
jgi:hypothetical protein